MSEDPRLRTGLIHPIATMRTLKGERRIMANRWLSRGTRMISSEDLVAELAQVAVGIEKSN
jgi:hypothetical protein